MGRVETSKSENGVVCIVCGVEPRPARVHCQVYPLLLTTFPLFNLPLPSNQKTWTHLQSAGANATRLREQTQ